MAGVAQSLPGHTLIPPFLLTEEAGQWLKQHLGQDPAEIALRNRHPHNRELCSQLLLQNKALERFPSWVHAGCIFHSLRLEQATAEYLTKYKPYGSGKLAVDLTAGMGVDTWALSGHYERIISCEPDPDTSALLRFNLVKLGIADVVTVLPFRAEECVAQGYADDADLIYIDPERRSIDGKRIHDLEHGSPDVFRLLPEIRRRSSGRVLIKASPMYDRLEATRRIPDIGDLYAMGYAGECRELLLNIGNKATGTSLHCRWGSTDDHWFSVDAEAAMNTPRVCSGVNGSWLIEGDATMYAMRLFPAWIQERLPEACISDAGGYALMASDPGPLPVPVYQVEQVFYWKPGEIRTELKRRKIDRVMIARRDFPRNTDEIRKALGVRDGGNMFLKCSRIQGKEYAFLCIRRKN